MAFRRLVFLSLVAAVILPWQQNSLAAFPAPTGPDRANLYQQIEGLRQRWKVGKLQASATADDAQTCQNWLDLLEDEGCIHPSAVTGTPLEMFDAMNAVHQQLVSKSAELPKTMDTLIGGLDRLSKIWFADGSVGDIAGPWTPLTTATVKRVDEHQLVLSAAAGAAPPIELTLTGLEGGVFRIHGPAQGFYQPDTLTARHARHPPDTGTGVTSRFRQLDAGSHPEPAAVSDCQCRKQVDVGRRGIGAARFIVGQSASDSAII